MKKEHVEGGLNQAAGKIQEKVGDLTGSDEQKLKGLKNQVKGTMQKGVGDVKEAFDDANKPAK